MDCNESQNRMSAYLDQELDPSAMAVYSAHLDTCAACRAAFEQLTALRAAIRCETTRHAAPEGLRGRILSDLAADRPRRDAPGMPGQFGNGVGNKFDHKFPANKFVGKFGKLASWPWARINFGVATVCSAAFAVTLALYLQAPSEEDYLDREIVATHFRSLQADHLADVVSSDHHTVKPWFSGKLDYSPPVVDLAPQGYALIGGRLDYLHRRSVAGLAYRHGKHLLNLFVWPAANRRDSAPSMTSEDGFQLLRWSHAGMAYTAVSDMAADELSEFQKLLMAQIDKDARAQ